MIFLSILPSMYIMETLFCRLVFHDIDTQTKYMYWRFLLKECRKTHYFFACIEVSRKYGAYGFIEEPAEISSYVTILL